MAKTVGCSDFNQNCEFRITASDAEVQLVEDVATHHALTYHPEFADNEADMRKIIRSQIKSLLKQSHTDLEVEAIMR